MRNIFLFFPGSCIDTSEKQYSVNLTDCRNEVYLVEEGMPELFHETLSRLKLGHGHGNRRIVYAMKMLHFFSDFTKLTNQNRQTNNKTSD
jgi:hypothetical protein